MLRFLTVGGLNHENASQRTHAEDGRLYAGCGIGLPGDRSTSLPLVLPSVMFSLFQRIETLLREPTHKPSVMLFYVVATRVRLPMLGAR